jgi:glycosyltransferase involved in cell wall biosynthesis
VTRFVSIVVPTRDRPQHLARCLAALTRLDRRHGRFEVIVVDDGGALPAATTVSAFARQLPVRCLTIPHAGPAAARNAGALCAQGELLAFTDDDCAPVPGWLDALVLAAARHPEAAWGGLTRNARPDNGYATATTLIVDRLTGDDFLPSSNLAMRADAFRDIGGFDASFAGPGGEDRDLCRRWVRSGRALIRVPGAVVDHRPAARLGPFLRQHFGYGRGTVQLLRTTGAIAVSTTTSRPSFYAGLFAAPFASLPPARAATIAGILLLAQGATLAGALCESLRRAR